MIKKLIKTLMSVCLVLGLLTGCEKFLNQKPNANLAVPSSAKDFQALLDHFQVINHADISATELSAADYFVLDEDWAARNEHERRMYLWENDNIFPVPPNDWFNCYRLIYRANAVLHDMGNVPSFNVTQWNDIRGQALFHRARGFFQAVTAWAPAYDAESANFDQGIPLRLNPDFNEVSTRSSVEQTYRQIIDDLAEAGSLLPATSPYTYRPSKVAAYGLLSRVFLSMREYDKALVYADSSLLLYDNLLDFNDIILDSNLPAENEEITFYSHMYLASRLLQDPSLKVADELIALYDNNDLRKQIYFYSMEDNNENPYTGFIGNYGENPFLLFSGLTTAEVLLNRAECYVRVGNVDFALRDINRLRSHRFAESSFQEFISSDQDEILAEILNERRKELLFRGIRWMDIKRLNKEGFNISLERSINGQTYRLEPNSPRFALPIPEDVVAISGIPQNQY